MEHAKEYFCFRDDSTLERGLKRGFARYRDGSLIACMHSFNAHIKRGNRFAFGPSNEANGSFWAYRCVETKF